jgi:hypothetical protein
VRTPQRRPPAQSSLSGLRYLAPADYRRLHFVLQPDSPFRVARRYLPDTNVLQTTFTTSSGTVRVTDALTLYDDATLTPARELQRRIEAVCGSVPMRWRVEPRFGYGAHAPRLSRRAGVPVAAYGSLAIGVCSWGTGTPAIALRHRPFPAVSGPRVVTG